MSGQPAILLFGHLVSAAAIFSTICTLNWISSVLFNYLNSINHFQPDIVRLANGFEVGSFLVDCIGSGAYLLMGMAQIVSKTWRIGR